MKIDLTHKDLLHGIAALIGGTTMLLYSLGIIERGITTLLILASLVLISYGIIKSGIYEKVRSMIR
jgi:hypothetical protein